MLIPIAVGLSAVIISLLVYIVFKKTALDRSNVPGPKAAPVVGNIFQFNLKLPHKTFREWSKQFGPMFRVKLLLSQAMVIITDPDIFQKDVLLRYKPKNLDTLDNLAKNGLVSLEGDKWKLHRTTLRPMFVNTFLENTVPIMQRCLQSFIDSTTEKLATSNNVEVEVEEPMKRMTMDVLSISMLSFDGKARTGEDVQRIGFNLGDAFTAILEESMMEASLPWLAYLPNKKLSGACNKIKGFAKMISDLHRPNNNNTKYGDARLERLAEKDLVDLLLEAEPDISEQDLMDEIIIFLFAGHDTTANTISFALYELAKHPDIQQRVYDEVIEVLGDEEPAFDRLNKLPYLRAVINETLRLYPPAPGTMRKTDKQDFVNNVLIPANTTLLVSFYAIHRDPKLWGEDAEVFNPDRFLEDTERHPCAFVPFSKGSRNCIGQPLAMLEASYFISQLIRRFKFSPASKEPSVVMKMTVTAEDGLYLNVQKRAQA